MGYHPIISLHFHVNCLRSERLLKKIVNKKRPFLVQSWENKVDYGDVEIRKKQKCGRGVDRNYYTG